VISWARDIPRPEANDPSTGVYIVALSDELKPTKATEPTCSLSRVALQELLAVRPELTLDGHTPDIDALAKRLSSFWCPDEVVLYIGLAGPRKHFRVSELSDRVEEYYNTPLGARSPHSGGWPLKTLTNLGALCVHYGYCDDVLKRERLMLEAFAANLSEETRAALHKVHYPMPFANLRDAVGHRKVSGISGARAPRLRSRIDSLPLDANVGTVENIQVFRAAPEASLTRTLSYQTQRITAGDIQKGIIRIPVSTKTLFPTVQTYLNLRFRGERKSCRWDPRYGPDKGRSGVLSIGKAIMRRLVNQGEQLSIRANGDVYFID
jgi:hypothetical protein